MNISQNFKNGFNKKNLLDDATGLAVPAWSAFAPTLVGANGWFGWAIAYIIPYLAGKAFGSNTLSTVALALGVSNIIYAYTDEKAVEWGLNKDDNKVARGLWYLDDPFVSVKKDMTKKSSYTATELTEMQTKDPKKYASLTGLGYVPYGQLPPGARTQIINGEPVTVYDSAPTISDYVGRNENLFLNDYIGQNESNLFDNSFSYDNDRM